MLAKRIIPIFLLKGQRLVKGTQFSDLMDVGDPISQGMIYDAQGADEIVIVDIEATAKNRCIDPHIINEMIHKCRLPIAAGGGIKDIRSAKKCFDAGADKIIVNSHAFLDPLLVKRLAREFGAQSVVVSVDVKRNRHGKYDVYIFSGKQKVKGDLKEYIDGFMASGAGEIILTVINKEGTLSGLDTQLYQTLRRDIYVPLIASGGVGCYDDFVDMFQLSGCDACGIGKMLFLRDYDIVRIKSYIKGKGIFVREA